MGSIFLVQWKGVGGGEKKQEETPLRLLYEKRALI